MLFGNTTIIEYRNKSTLCAHARARERERTYIIAHKSPNVGSLGRGINMGFAHISVVRSPAAPEKTVSSSLKRAERPRTCFLPHSSRGALGTSLATCGAEAGAPSTCVVPTASSPLAASALPCGVPFGVGAGVSSGVEVSEVAGVEGLAASRSLGAQHPSARKHVDLVLRAPSLRGSVPNGAFVSALTGVGATDLMGCCRVSWRVLLAAGAVLMVTCTIRAACDLAMST